jgi:hypothetical protein
LFRKAAIQLQAIEIAGQNARRSSTFDALRASGDDNAGASAISH